MVMILAEFIHSFCGTFRSGSGLPARFDPNRVLARKPKRTYVCIAANSSSSLERCTITKTTTCAAERSRAFDYIEQKVAVVRAGTGHPMYYRAAPVSPRDAEQSRVSGVHRFSGCKVSFDSLVSTALTQ